MQASSSASTNDGLGLLLLVSLKSDKMGMNNEVLYIFTLAGYVCIRLCITGGEVARGHGQSHCSIAAFVFLPGEWVCLVVHHGSEFVFVFEELH